MTYTVPHQAKPPHPPGPSPSGSVAGRFLRDRVPRLDCHQDQRHRDDPSNGYTTQDRIGEAQNSDSLEAKHSPGWELALPKAPTARPRRHCAHAQRRDRRSRAQALRHSGSLGTPSHEGTSGAGLRFTLMIESEMFDISAIAEPTSWLRCTTRRTAE